MKLYKKFLKRMETDNGYDNEKLAKDLQIIAENHQYKQLNMHDVSMRSEQFNCEGCRWYNSCALRIDYNNVRCDEFENN